MTSSTIDMEKLLTFVRSLTVKARFKVAALSFLLVAAFLFSSCCCYADSFVDSRFLDTQQVRVSAGLDLGAAYVIRAALAGLTVQTISDSLNVEPADIARAIAYGGGSTLPPAYTYVGSLLEFLNRSVIRIRPDSVTIDGVEYSDVWLPHDCADKFRTNAFDFITRYNISSESVGTFVSGSGNFDGILFYDNDGTLITQTFVCPFVAGSSSFGNGSLVSNLYNNTNIRYRYLDSRNFYHDCFGYYTAGAYPISFYLYIDSQSSIYSHFQTYDGRSGNTYFASSGSYVSSPFDFDYVTSSIPVVPLPSDYGFRTRLPSTYVRDLPQILDPASSSYESDLASLISGIESAASSDSLVDSTFEAWDSPAPGSGTIADEPYSSLSGSLSGIQSIISSISSSVSGIAESIVGADSTFFGNIVSALATPFEPVFAVFRSGVGIWRYVVSWVGAISAPFTWSLSALGSAGSYFLSPIYAAAAAAVVLAVYKKFGR